MSCSWFLLKPQHEIIKEVKVLGDIHIETEEENFSATVTQTDEINVSVETEEYVATVETNEIDVILDTEDICVTIDGRVIFDVTQPTNFIFRETPSGNIDGVNVIFTLANIPQLDSEIVIVNGIILKDTQDYTILNDVITFVNPPQAGDTVLVNYIKETNFIFREMPIGIIDGINLIFALANIPQFNSEIVILNGMIMKDTQDYTIFSNTITLISAPQVGDTLLVNYIIK